MLLSLTSLNRDLCLQLVLLLVLILPYLSQADVHGEENAVLLSSYVRGTASLTKHHPMI